MGFPHNFWVGLGCWILAMLLVIRIFWIFPALAHRLSGLEKALIVSLAVVLFSLAVRRPILSAYMRRNGNNESKKESYQPQPQSEEKRTEPPPDVSPATTPTATIPKAKSPKVPSTAKSKALPQSETKTPSAPLTGDNNGTVGGGITTGPCSNVQVGGSQNQATVNCIPPEPSVFVTSDPISANGKTGIRVTLRTNGQLMNPAFTLVLDHTITEGWVTTSYALNTIDSHGIGTAMGSAVPHNGFQFQITAPSVMPAEGKIFVTVFADEPLKLMNWGRN